MTETTVGTTFSATSATTVLKASIAPESLTSGFFSAPKAMEPCSGRFASPKEQVLCTARAAAARTATVTDKGINDFKARAAWNFLLPEK